MSEPSITVTDYTQSWRPVVVSYPSNKEADDDIRTCFQECSGRIPLDVFLAHARSVSGLPDAEIKIAGTIKWRRPATAEESAARAVVREKAKVNAREYRQRLYEELRREFG
jgi:hypothetical protein